MPFRILKIKFPKGAWRKPLFYFYIFKKIIKKYKNYEKYGIILKNPFNKLLYINKYDEIRRKI